MNDTENYLLHKKSTLARSISTGFLMNLVGAIIAFVLIYIIYGIFIPDAHFRVVQTVIYSDIFLLMKSLCLTQNGNIVALLVLFFSAYTVCSKAISFSLCVWRGASLGCMASMLEAGLIDGISEHWNIGLSLSFFSTVIFILLSSYSAVYSDCILKTCAVGEYRYTSSLTGEYFRCFLTLSGGVLTAGICSALLL